MPAGADPRGAAAGALLLAALLAACATTAPEPPLVRASHIPDSEASYVLDPLVGFPLAADPELERRVRRGYATLEAGGDLAALESAMGELLEEDDGFHPARVLQAQLAFLGGERETARALLTPIADELPDYLACQVLLGRSAELLGELPLAHASFRRAAAGSSAARDRAAALEPRVIEILVRGVEDLIGRGRLEEAEQQLFALERWAADELAVLRARRSLERAKGDLEAELVVLRRLVEIDPADELTERLADLEIALGDVREGLEKLERLAAVRPGDAALIEKTERAKFLWRLQLLPTYVLDLASEGVLDRSEFATLLYWLVPAVRYAEVTDPPIATDILDHPRREEILRVMNLNLIRVDEALHRFSPEQPATRALALRALLGLLDLSKMDFACVSAPEVQALANSDGLACRKAAQCRLIPEEADCLPQARLSGPEALDLFRRGLELLGSR